VVMREFFAQGDKEKSNDMPVSPGFDRVTTSIPNMQVNFIEFVVGPLYKNLIKICPDLGELGVQIVYNRQEWGDRMLLEADQKAASRSDKEIAAKESQNKRDNETKRRAKFKGGFEFVYERQRALKASDPFWAKRVPGARGLDFSGSMGTEGSAQSPPPPLMK